MGMLSLRINGSRPKGPPTDLSRITRGLGGYTYRVHSRVPSDQETWLSLGTMQPPHRARGLARVSSSQSTTCLSSGLGSCPACDADQGPGARIQAPSHQGSGAPRRRALDMALLATSTIGSRTGCDTRRQASHSLQRPGRLLGPYVSPWS
jgi:hypothetical protein